MSPGAALTALLQRGALAGIAVLLASLPLPYVLGFSGLAPAAAGALVFVMAGLFACAEPRHERLVFLSLFAWGYLLRFGALLTLYSLAPAAQSVLGPDSVTYLRMSQFMAESELVMTVHPVVLFGTYDVAQYYLFASVLYALDGDLFTLKLLNCGLTALAAPLVFSWCRLVLPRLAVVAGVIMAVHPSVITISVVDLLKDPAILFFMVVAVWSLSRLLAAQSRGSGAAFGLIAAGALIFLRMGRFYVTAYLELAFLVVGVASRLWRRRGLLAPARRGVLAVTLGVFLTAEVVPMQFGWPASPLMVANNVAHVLGVPEMRFYAAGLLDRWGGRRDAPRSGAGDRSKWTRRIGSGWVGRVALEVATATANLVRRVFGPFVWILPERWNVREILGGDYLLYPGMIVWYGLLPFTLTGLLAVGHRVLVGKEPDLGLATIWLFLIVYFAQYLAINLSYRQRDVMFPFLLVFALIGLQHVRGYGGWRWVYGAYWGLLASMAVAHTLVRAGLGV